MQRFFDDDGFHFATLIALGSAYRGLADVGEVLATIERIPEADRDAWVSEFSATAKRLADAGDASAHGGHGTSARTAWLRASLYYDLASSMAPGTSDPDRYHSLWEQSRALWDNAIDLWPTPVDRVRIPYEDGELEGYLWHPAGDTREPLPTVILNNGSDGPVNAMWTQGGAAAVERGWRALAFDGPGQGVALHRHGMHFRPDWEAVVTPVVDFLGDRSDVDAERIVLHGISQAGYWVPRAAAFEHRLAAVVADPGCTNVAASWETHLPDSMSTMLDDGDREDFDEFMEIGMSDDPVTAAELAWRMAPYGTKSYYEAYQAARAQSLDDETIAKITSPTLVTSPDHEQFWPGQSEALYDKLRCEKQLIRFTVAEGADWHCEVAAQSLRDERVFDWIEDVLSGLSKSSETRRSGDRTKTGARPGS